ncbi:MAG TPA: hypothetical protein VD713_02220 [Sphingomonadales bacterium]|nr:hypothetical protein [Sphingomonadales bacterium]
MAHPSFEETLRDPARMFAAPADVLAAPFTPKEKTRILEQWKFDAIELSRSVAEGMEGPNTGETLRQVQDALETLKG